MTDPRDNGETVGSDGAAERPLCPRCLTPFELEQHYCHKCGDAVGHFTPYIPFVNIRFNYGIFGRMWHKLWRDREAGFLIKGVCAVLIVVLAPVMLVGLPFVIWERACRSRLKRQ